MRLVLYLRSGQMEQLLCEQCGETLECYWDDRRRAMMVFPCEGCMNECEIESRGLGYTQGATDFDPDFDIRIR